MRVASAFGNTFKAHSAMMHFGGRAPLAVACDIPAGYMNGWPNARVGRSGVVKILLFFHTPERRNAWGGLQKVNEELTNRGFPLNLQGGVVKASPDGGLLQSSTVAERIPIVFSDGSNALLPGAYMEFAERLVLPEFQHLKPEEVREEHRRDGFEVGNADNIFASTKLAVDEPVKQPMADWT